MLRWQRVPSKSKNDVFIGYSTRGHQTFITCSIYANVSSLYSRIHRSMLDAYAHTCTIRHHQSVLMHFSLRPVQLCLCGIFNCMKVSIVYELCRKKFHLCERCHATQNKRKKILFIDRISTKNEKERKSKKK